MVFFLCRNYGETLHSVATAPFEEVTTPKVLHEIIDPATSPLQVLDGPALLNRELQSGYWGGLE